jgi:hypothetical protein
MTRSSAGQTPNTVKAPFRTFRTLKAGAHLLGVDTFGRSDFPDEGHVSFRAVTRRAGTVLRVAGTDEV